MLNKEAGTLGTCLFVYISLPDTYDLLHAEADGGDGYPAAQADEDGLAAGAYELYYVGVQADGGHRHYDEELAELLEWREHASGHSESGGDGGYQRSQHKEKYEEGEYPAQ